MQRMGGINSLVISKDQGFVISVGQVGALFGCLFYLLVKFNSVFCTKE
jgi:hypothetical protein